MCFQIKFKNSRHFTSFSATSQDGAVGYFLRGPVKQKIEKSFERPIRTPDREKDFKGICLYFSNFSLFCEMFKCLKSRLFRRFIDSRKICNVREIRFRVAHNLQLTQVVSLNRNFRDFPKSSYFWWVVFAFFIVALRARNFPIISKKYYCEKICFHKL